MSQGGFLYLPPTLETRILLINWSFLWRQPVPFHLIPTEHLTKTYNKIDVVYSQFSHPNREVISASTEQINSDSAGMLTSYLGYMKTTTITNYDHPPERRTYWCVLGTPNIIYEYNIIHTSTNMEVCIILYSYIMLGVPRTHQYLRLSGGWS